VVDLPDSLVRFVNAVGEGQSDMAGFGVELGKNGVAKSLGCDAGAVGDEKNSAIGHAVDQFQMRWSTRPLESVDYPWRHSSAVPSQEQVIPLSCALVPGFNFGALYV